MKDTRLKEDAAIYNHREDKTEKEKWSSLTVAKKAQYFKDYYLKYVILGIAAAAFLGWLIYTLLAPKPKNALSVSFISSAVTEEASDNLASALGQYLDIDEEKEDIFIDTTLFIDQDNMSEASVASEQKISVYAMTGEYDIVIASKDTFTRYASNGFFAELTEALPSDLYNDFSERFCMVMTQNEEDGGLEEELPYGISLKGYPRFEELNSGISDPVLAIMASSNNQQNAAKAIKWFTSTK